MTLNPHLSFNGRCEINALTRNGTVRTPLGEPFWAIRFGMLIVQFGIPWMVNCERSA